MHDDGFFDETVAKTYDRDHGGTDPETIAGAADRLAKLAGSGAVLEFAIGTGRMALPLFERGIAVDGIELSTAMVKQMRKKDGGSSIDVTIGDMTTTRLKKRFSLVYLVFNTIDNLTSQAQQVACFQNAAAHLDTGGRFLIETRVPPLQKIQFGETKLAWDCSPDHWGIDIFDVVTQNYSSNHIWMKDGSHSHLSIPFRYAWPCELDLMAQLAGLALEHRWENWQRAPFTNRSETHISVWRKMS